jgi:hypothetical protein
VPELGTLGSVRGALSSERPYRDLRNVVANYPFERSHRFAGIQSNSGFRDYSRLSCGVGDTQLGAGICRDLQQAFCTEVGHHAASTRRHELAAISFVGIVFVASDNATSDGQLGITYSASSQHGSDFQRAPPMRSPRGSDPDRHSPESFPILSRFMSAKSARRHSGEKMP